jgi:pyocin large subunit-like protein
MSRAFRSFFFAFLCLVAGTWLLCGPRKSQGPGAVSAAPAAASPAVEAPGAAPRASAPAAPPLPRSAIGFRNRQRLDEHFDKHGAEFNAPNADAYLSLAQALRAAPPSATVRELQRPTDGVIAKFDRATGAFVAFDADSIIRTFFKPNDGEAYFERQARRRPRS